MPTALNAVINISHHNKNLDFSKIRRAGIVGVFPKATLGQSNVDQTDAAHRKAAVAAGLLWAPITSSPAATGGGRPSIF